MLIKNGKLVYKDKVIEADIGINDGKISEIFISKDNKYKAQRILDAKNKYVLPGLIDSHVHFRTPGLTNKETWKTASMAAVAGGITTVLDMPNTMPYLSKVSLLQEKEELIKNNSYVDYGFHFGVEPNNVQQLNLIEKGMVSSIKVFLTGHHTAKNVITNQEDLEKIFQIASEKDIILTFHAEDEDTLNILRRTKKPPSDLIEYEEYLPRTAGIIAINRILKLMDKYKARVHILHVSSKEEVDLLIAAGKLGYSISYETTPHHLWFNNENNIRLGTKIKLSPAIRSAKDQKALWESLITGSMISVGSDHAPHSKSEKALSLFEAPPGLPGVQEMLSVLVTGLKINYPKLSMDDIMSHIVRVLSYGPAQLFGIDKQKGNIKEGLDADLVILDSDLEWSIEEKDVYSLCKWSAYESINLKAKPLITIRSGEIIYENGIFGPKNGKLLFDI